jgi:hypothetical protein
MNAAVEVPSRWRLIPATRACADHDDDDVPEHCTVARMYDTKVDSDDPCVTSEAGMTGWAARSARPVKLRVPKEALVAAGVRLELPVRTSVATLPIVGTRLMLEAAPNDAVATHGATRVDAESPDTLMLPERRMLIANATEDDPSRSQVAFLWMLLPQNTVETPDAVKVPGVMAWKLHVESPCRKA